GNLWVGGRWTAGQIRWTQDLAGWLNRPWSQIYAVAFGDPYQGPCARGFCNRPFSMFPAVAEFASIRPPRVAPEAAVCSARARWPGPPGRPRSAPEAGSDGGPADAVRRDVRRSGGIEAATNRWGSAVIFADGDGRPAAGAARRGIGPRPGPRAG